MSKILIVTFDNVNWMSTVAEGDITSGGPGSGISMSSSMSGSFPIPGSGCSTSVSGFDVPDVPVRPTVLDTPRLLVRFVCEI